MSGNPGRLKALAVTCIAVVLALTAISSESAFATEPGSNAVASSNPSLSPTATAMLTSSIEPSPTPSPSASPTVSSTTTTTSPTTATAPTTVAAVSVVVAMARSHLGASYQHYATGPFAFDCSGLIWRVFHDSHLGSKVTGRSARTIYLWYRSRGLASRSNAHRGDIVVWGYGSHVGIYIGNGYAISALISGVRIHRVNAMFTPFTAFLHTRLSNLTLPRYLLDVASHMKSLRHTTRSIAAHSGPSSASSIVTMLSDDTRFVVLQRAYDSSGRRWWKVLTFWGRSGWIRPTYTSR